VPPLTYNVNNIPPYPTCEDFRDCKKLCVYVGITQHGKNRGKWTGPPIPGPRLTYLEVNIMEHYPQHQQCQRMLDVLLECRPSRSLRLTGVIRKESDWPAAGLCTLPQLELLELTQRTEYYPPYLHFTQMTSFPQTAQTQHPRTEYWRSLRACSLAIRIQSEHFVLIGIPIP